MAHKVICKKQYSINYSISPKMEPKLYFACKTPQITWIVSTFPKRNRTYSIITEKSRKGKKNRTCNKTLIRTSWFQQFCYTLRWRPSLWPAGIPHWSYPDALLVMRPGTAGAYGSPLHHPQPHIPFSWNWQFPLCLSWQTTGRTASHLSD